MKQLLQLWKAIIGYFYLYNWMKPIVCRWFGHKKKGKLYIYEQSKKKNKNGVMMYKKRYDPYFIYTCARCGKPLGAVRERRKLTKEEALEYMRQVREIEQRKRDELIKFKEGK